LRRWVVLFITCLFVAGLSAWDGNTQTAVEKLDQDITEATVISLPEAKAEEKKGEEVSLKNADGTVVATATLTPADGGVHVVLDVDGLPEGTHAFHVHEKGVCEPPDFESAGGHYNPTNMKHGKLNPEGPHAGDFDNIEVDKNGKAHVEFTTNQVTLEKGKENTLYTDEGTSLVIHADPDDYKSQPSGNAGERIACGVISE